MNSSIEPVQPQPNQLIPNLSERTSIVGLFSDVSLAEQAIVDLQAAGFMADSIGAAMRDQSEESELLNDTGVQGVDEVAKGGGGLIGSIITNLFGDRTHPTGADLIAILVGMGVPDSEARHFENGLGKGGALVTVDARGIRTTDALAILSRHGADTAGLAESSSANRTQGLASDT
ncbi:MAG: general stress protein [Gemmatimonadaceae bacterium]|nr:general stress protein [Gloeobacterales cyanobacterium ES-bin-141]